MLLRPSQLLTMAAPARAETLHTASRPRILPNASSDIEDATARAPLQLWQANEHYPACPLIRPAALILRRARPGLCALACERIVPDYFRCRRAPPATRAPCNLSADSLIRSLAQSTSHGLSTDRARAPLLPVRRALAGVRIHVAHSRPEARAARRAFLQL